jgi:hypothetical protein
MNCDTTRRQLLASLQPEKPSAEARAHLALCPACRSLHRRLVQIERQLPLLPVPPSAARDALLQTILEEPAPAPEPLPAPARPTVRLPWQASRGSREGGRQKLALAFALTAALVVIAVTLLLWPQASPSSRQGMFAELQKQRDDRLRAARTPRQRVETLAKLADEVMATAHRHSGDARRMAQVADFYRELVREDLPRHAEKMPTTPEESKALAAVAECIRRHESAALQLAAKLKNGPPTVLASLNRIATAAREGSAHLRALAGSV